MRYARHREGALKVCGHQYDSNSLTKRRSAPRGARAQGWHFLVDLRHKHRTHVSVSSRAIWRRYSVLLQNTAIAVASLLADYSGRLLASAVHNSNPAAIVSPIRCAHRPTRNSGMQIADNAPGALGPMFDVSGLHGHELDPRVVLEASLFHSPPRLPFLSHRLSPVEIPQDPC